MWGAVTKFSMLYKDPDTDEWEYYTDTAGTPRVRTYNGWLVVVGGQTIQCNTARLCGHAPGEDVQRMVGGGEGQTRQYNTARLCGHAPGEDVQRMGGGGGGDIQYNTIQPDSCG